MPKYISTTIAISILLIASGCSTTNNNGTQPAQQVRACNAGDPHPWCMQMAQTRPLGAAPYGLESTAPTNPEMQDDNTPYPRNPALPLTSPGMGPIMLGAPR